MSVASAPSSTVVRAYRASCEAISDSTRLADYVDMCRPRIAVMTALSVAAGFVLASPIVIEWAVLVTAMSGILCLVAASSILNQVLESSTDALMNRTSDRAIVSGRVSRTEAAFVGALFAIAGAIILALFSNPITMIAGLGTMLVYVFAYTPLKTRSTLCTTVGAIPGAMPPVLGWLAAGGTPGMGALALFALVFTWQFPHFLAIGWIYRHDYQHAGLKMLPSFVDNGRRTGMVAVIYAAGFIAISTMPTYAGLTGRWYLLTALVCSIVYFVASLRFSLKRTKERGRTLLLTSLAILPLLLIVMVAEFLHLTAPG